MQQTMPADPLALFQQQKKQIDLLLAQGEQQQDDADQLFLLASEAKELSHEAQYTHGQALSALMLAGYYDRKGSLPDALEECFNALSVSRSSGDVATQVHALYVLAGLYQRMNDTGEAIACVNQGIELLDANDALLRLGLSPLLYQMQMLQGDLLLSCGRHGEALAHYQEALPAAQDAGGQVALRLHLSISECHLISGNHSAAMDANRKAMSIALAHRLGPAELTIIEIARGTICERSADLSCALLAYKDALNHAIRANSKYTVCFVLAYIGKVQLGLKQVNTARATLNKALAIAWEIGSDELAREIHERLTLWYDERDYLDSALCSADAAPHEDGALRQRVRRLLALQAKQSPQDHKDIFRLINEEIQDHLEEIHDLRQDIEEQTRHMVTVAEISRSLADTTDLKQSVLRISVLLEKVLAYDSIAVGTLGESQKHVEYLAACRQGEALAVERRTYPADIMKALRNGRDVILTDIPVGDGTRYAMLATDAPPRSALFCSFACAGAAYILTIQSNLPDAFDSTDMRLLRTLAQVVGLAMGAQLGMATLVQKEQSLRQLIRTDALTGLLSRHNIIERIAEENIRTQRNQKPFTLVLIEVDQLRALRDSFGQECFDALLKQLSRLLRPSIRKQDFLARWSDDQFAILLPETDGDGAEKLCEKLRQKAAKQAFARQGEEIRLTLTCGLAEHRAARTLDAMQKAAESALLAAKLKGRDCVEKR